MSEAGTRALVPAFYEDFDSGDIDAAVAAFSEALETIDPGMRTVRGIEPTGASVEVRFADVSRGADGLIVAYHTYYDQLGMLTQLGLMGDG
jgi:ketosteroid isomerase-like protein